MWVGLLDLQGLFDLVELPAFDSVGARFFSFALSQERDRILGFSEIYWRPLARAARWSDRNE